MTQTSPKQTPQRVFGISGQLFWEVVTPDKNKPPRGNIPVLGAFISPDIPNIGDQLNDRGSTFEFKRIKPIFARHSITHQFCAEVVLLEKSASPKQEPSDDVQQENTAPALQLVPVGRS